MKYLRMQVEVDVRAPIPAGFFQERGSGGSWIQFRYEKLANMCYMCGRLGHLKVTCKASSEDQGESSEEVCGAWLRAEPNAYSLVKEDHHLRRVEIPRGDYFDSFSQGASGDAVTEEEADQNRETEKVDLSEKDPDVAVEEGIEKSTLGEGKGETDHKSAPISVECQNHVDILGQASAKGNFKFQNSELKIDPSEGVGLSGVGVVDLKTDRDNSSREVIGKTEGKVVPEASGERELDGQGEKCGLKRKLEVVGPEEAHKPPKKQQGNRSGKRPSGSGIATHANHREVIVKKPNNLISPLSPNPSRNSASPRLRLKAMARGKPSGDDCGGEEEVGKGSKKISDDKTAGVVSLILPPTKP